jgi:transposase
MKKLKSSQLVKAYSELTNIVKSKGKEKINALSQKNEKFLDVVCHCVSNGINNIPKKDYSRKDWKKLRIQKENLRFLSDYIKCNKSKKKCLKRQRHKIVQQSGGSISLILSIVLPMLANVLIDTIRK